MHIHFRRLTLKKLDELSCGCHIYNNIESIFLIESCSDKHHSTSHKPSTSSTRCSLEPDYKPNYSDSYTDSDASGFIQEAIDLKSLKGGEPSCSLNIRE